MSHQAIGDAAADRPTDVSGDRTDVPPDQRDVALDQLDVPDVQDVTDVTDAPDGDVPVASCDGGASCSGVCVDLSRDPQHCGDCAIDCTSLPNVSGASVHCTASACNLTGACLSGHGDCDGIATNGCETDLTTAAHCGACTVACTGGTPNCSTSSGAYTCVSGCMPPTPDLCGSSCVSVTTDVNNCGMCGHACAFGPHSTPNCTSSTCGIACEAGYADCDGIASNGCEINTRTDPMRCGACNFACPTGPNASATCTAGICGIACNAGFGDCDAIPTNGCEANVTTDPAHCGTSPNSCPVPTNSARTCVAGVCGFTCNAGSGDCDGVVANGCEANLATSPANCGTCGTTCTAPANSMATCTGSVCGSMCLTGFADCDGSPANGCEANLSGDVSHCGNCSTACPAGANGTAVCTSGTCGFICASGTGNCDGVLSNGCEAVFLTDPQHCGSCSGLCPARTNATATCTSGTCGFACNAGSGDCNGNVADGCEATFATDPMHCGNCTTVCPARTNASPSCASGVCGYACNTGTADCDGSPANGCEAVFATDPLHCGNCATVCPTGPNATPSCVSGTCALTCISGTGNCDGSGANGCEAVFLSDPLHCGSCANACPTLANATTTCSAGTCGFTCNAGFGDCDSIAINGCEANFATDPLHCGSCAGACPARTNATSTCAGSVCGFTCNAGAGNCDGIATNGCEVTFATDPNHCGNCATICPVRPNATPTCAAGTCGIACNAGTGNCDGDPSNGCEAVFLTDPLHCGSCPNACPTGPNATATCAAGACSLTCTAGYGNCDGGAANGCEAVFASDPNHCGNCSTVCTAPTNGTAVCSSGVCSVTCNAGYVPSRGACVPTSSETCPGTSIAMADGDDVVVYGTTAGHTSSSQGSCGGNTTPDVLYTVTPSVTGRLTITSSAFYDAIVYVRSGCTTTELRCFHPGTGVGSNFVDVTAGSPVAIYVDGAAGAAGAYALELQMGVPCGNHFLDQGEACDDGNRVNGDGCRSDCTIEVNATDACPAAGAPAISVGRGPTWFSGTTIGTAADLVSGCVAVGGSDVVYNVLASVTGTMRATVMPTQQWDLQVYARTNATCAGMTDLACANNAGQSAPETITFAVTAGQRYSVVVDGVNGSQGTFDVTFEVASCGDGTLQTGEVCDDGNTTPGDGCDATCQIEATCSTTESEPNIYSAPDAIALTCPTYVVRGAINPMGDDDFFSVTLRAGQIVDLRTFVNSVLQPSRNADTVLEIYRSPIGTQPINTQCGGGTAIDCQDDLINTGDLLSGFTYPVPADGTYVFRVLLWGNTGTLPNYGLWIHSR